MASANARWSQVALYAFAGFLVLVTLVASWAGAPWFLVLAGLCIVSIIVIGRRRILRPGIARTLDEIVCRYVPWYEGNAYTLNFVLPLMGITMVAAGYAQGYPVWLSYGGFILLLAVVPLGVFATIRMRRRCFLRIAASALTVQLADRDATEIPRERIESIAPAFVPNGVSVPSRQIEIAYRGTDPGSGTIQTVVLGIQLTVEPVNLLNALTTWKDATHADSPEELLNRVERILQGRLTTGV
jgi:hypothetical protein